ncbi:acyltransferase family protein [bacterium 210820-DFI.6.52]|nr:acyltransferase family protein [bacterium 210820-DFI.6.52]
MIELLRFLFAAGIVLFHGLDPWNSPTYFSKIHLFHNGAVAVEFFFILSGFLMAKSAAHNAVRVQSTPLGQETVSFLVKKYTGIFPYHLYAYILSFILMVAGNSYTPGGVVRLFFNSLPHLFMLDMSGLSFTMINGYEWYISAMLLVMFVIYPILCRKADLFIKVISPIAALFIYGLISKNWGTVTYISLWTGYLYKGVLRASAAIMLGCISYGLCGKIKNYTFTKAGTILLSIIEIGIYFITFVYINLVETDRYYIYFAFFLTIAVAITFSEQSLTARLSGRGDKLFFLLGRLSLTLYLCQWSVRTLLLQYFDFIGAKGLLTFFVGTLANALICLFTVDLIRKKVHLKKLFIESGSRP